MAKLMIRIHNTETGEIIDREMTTDEIAEHNRINQQIDDNLQTVFEARQALLDKLGITEEEAKLLLS